MKPSYQPPTLIVLALGILAVLALQDSSPSQAQGQVQVNAADPAAAEQGTINLNVRVTGKGFKAGARAQWFVTGTTNPGGVTVNSTTFVSSTELTANITVADTAVIANFDIQVLNSDGRGGKGTELFAVTAKGQAVCPAMQPVPTSDTKCYDFIPGCLDSTFGSGGFVYTNLAAFNGQTQPQTASAMAVQNDGKIVVAATVLTSSSGSDYLVLRYNADGSLDPSFGDPDAVNPPLRLGYALAAITTGNDYAKSVVLQSDGKILIAGSANGTQEMAAARFSIDGTLDASFGIGGIGRVSFGRNLSAEANNAAQQSDGKLLLLGRANNQISFARLNPNGSLDSNFGSGGKLSVNASGAKGGTGNGLGLALQRVPAVTGEERIVAAGWSKTSSNANSDWTLMRLRPDGSTDTSFGIGGIVKTAFSGFGDVASRVKMDSSSRLVAIGSTNTNSTCGLYVQDGAVVRYTQDGNLDGSFSGGRQIIDVYGGMDLFGAGLSFQADGKILIFGSAHSSDDTVIQLALIRFNVDGTRDASFGLQGNGVTTFDVTQYNGSGAPVSVQPPDGKIVVMGNLWGTVGRLIAIGRYMP